jgi:hypothetical protein
VALKIGFIFNLRWFGFDRQSNLIQGFGNSLRKKRHKATLRSIEMPASRGKF